MIVSVVQVEDVGARFEDLDDIGQDALTRLVLVEEVRAVPAVVARAGEASIGVLEDPVGRAGGWERACTRPIAMRGESSAPRKGSDARGWVVSRSAFVPGQKRTSPAANPATLVRWTRRS